jgi:hypothetical protein
VGHTQGNAIFGGINGPKRTTVTGEAITTAIIVARIIGTVAKRIILNRIVGAVANRVAFSPGGVCFSTGPTVTSSGDLLGALDVALSLSKRRTRCGSLGDGRLDYPIGLAGNDHAAETLYWQEMDRA